MKLAHLSDIHLGFRRYYRQTAGGINQREADVAQAFRRALADVVRARPDLVVIAGDVFHSVRPTNLAILDAFNRVRGLREALPGTPVVIVAGDHDTPRSVESGSILRLFEALEGVWVAADEVRHLTFDDLDLSLLAVPDAALKAEPRPSVRPPDGARHRVLVTHMAVAGAAPWETHVVDFGGVLMEPGDLHAEEWSYVALGHYHVAQAVRENAWYAGALDYVSPNPWGELRDEERAGRPGRKGWLLVDLSRGVRVEFRPVELARRVIDLPPIPGAGRRAEDIDREIAARVEAVPGGIDGQIVRQVIQEVPRTVARELNYGRIRQFKTQALHYHLDLRRPPPARAVGVGAPGRRQTLPEIVRDYLARRPLDPAVDRERLVALGQRYLEEAGRDPDEG